MDHFFKQLRDQSHGQGDSDRHLLTLYGIGRGSRAKRILELGIREGRTTLPLLLAAHENGGTLISVDNVVVSYSPPVELEGSWQHVVQDSLIFLEERANENCIFDLIYLDDWHAYSHVKAELELIDQLVTPSSVVLIHDLMYWTSPYYHSDLTLREGQWADGGPYRAVAELNPQFWEWSTLPWSSGLTILRKKYSSRYHTSS